MEKTKIEVDLVIKDGDSVGTAEKKTMSLKAQLKEMKALLASGTLDAGAFNKLAKEAGELQDQIADVNQRVKNLASDSQKLDGFISIAQGIVGGFAAVQGITALVGDENEDLQKTMVKLQGAMSALSGIQAVANTLNKDSAALTAITAFRTGALVTIQKIYTLVTGQATAATKGFTVALAATGIGLIVIALGALVYAMDKFTGATEEQEKAMERLNDELATNKQFLEDTAILYDQEAKMSIIRAKMLGANEETIRALEAEARAKRIQELKDFHAEAERLQAAWNVNNYQNTKEAQEAHDKLADNTTEAARKLLAAQQADELATAQATLDSKKAVDQHNAAFDKAAQDKADAFNKARNERIKKQKEDEAAAEIKERFEDEQERKEIQELIAARDKKQREDALANTFTNMQEDLRLKRIVRERDQKERDDELKRIQANEAAKVAIAQGTFDTLTNLGEIFIGQQFRQTAIGKILALTQIAIDTARAISSLVAASEANPTNAVTYGLAGAAQFVAGLARITGNVLQAKRVLNGGGIGGNSGGGSPSSSIPNSQPPSSSSYSKNNQQNQPGIVKVVIMENEMTTTQVRVLKIRENAEII